MSAKISSVTTTISETDLMRTSVNLLMWKG